MIDRPLSAGPWQVHWWKDTERPWMPEKFSLTAGDVYLICEGYHCEEDEFNLSQSDGALISLAPDMAEAILDHLEICDLFSDVGIAHNMCEDPVCAVALKLRDIVETRRK